MATTVLFVIFGLFLMRVVPMWINFPYRWLNILLKTISIIVGLLIFIFFLCSIFYNFPRIINNLIF